MRCPTEINSQKSPVPAHSINSPRKVFLPAFDRFNTNYIAILWGRYLSIAQLIDAQGILHSVQCYGVAGLDGHSWATVRQTREEVTSTRLINSLNKGRKWSRLQLADQIASMLEPDLAIAVVPPHDPWTADAPIRMLAKEVATLSNGTQVDATACLVRHTEIKRIVFGGPSTRALHRATIRVEYSELVAGRRVLLLDDIAKSGQSLAACKAMLYEAGAKWVQMAALGRVM